LGGGFNALALEYKGIDGQVLDQAVLTAATEVLRYPGLTLTAILSVGVDNTVPFGGNTAWALKHVSGVNFKDASDRRWLNLYLPEVRDFIKEHVIAAYDAGFDRVLLCHMGFPYSPGSGQINYGGLDLEIGAAGAVNALISELRDAAGERYLDVLLFEEGFIEEAGQDAERFAHVFDLILIRRQDDDTVNDEFGGAYELQAWN
jgi:hypothetical protein